MITLIAAIGKNNELGFNNRLLWNIPEDMNHFKSYTVGKTVIMGRKTFISIGRPLPYRKNIVVSTNSIVGDVIKSNTIEDALSFEQCCGELVVIGGASIYSQVIDVADKLVITHIDAGFEADTFFPRFDLSRWQINNVINGSNETYEFKFVEYVRNESIGDFKRKAS